MELSDKLKEIELSMALDLKRVCEENDIKYFLDSGSVLGAVRHKGFIPWDDDMDIGMLREDYERFLEIAGKKLSSENQLVEWRSEKDYPHQFAKIMKRGTIFKEQATFGNAPCGVFIDIFPYDKFPKDIKKRKYQGFLLNALRSMIRAKCKHKTWYADDRFYFNRWVKNLPFRVLSLFFSKAYLVERYEKIATRYNDSDDFDSYFPQGIEGYGEWVIPRECLEKTRSALFEKNEFEVPFNTEQYLTICYGDYMTPPPLEKRVTLHSTSVIDLGKYGQE